MRIEHLYTIANIQCSIINTQFKIKEAIIKGFKSENSTYDNQIFANIQLKLESKDTWSVEEIQDLIEQELFSKNYFDVMRSFMLYRHTRKLQRQTTPSIDSNTTYVNSTQTIDIGFKAEGTPVKVVDRPYKDSTGAEKPGKAYEVATVAELKAYEKANLQPAS